MDEAAPTRYAKSGDVYIAYKTFGEGEDDVLVTLAGTLTMEFMQSSATVQQVSRSARVTIFDKRGTGESDRVGSLTFEERVDDLGAVMDAVGIEAAHLYGSSEVGHDAARVQQVGSRPSR